MAFGYTAGTTIYIDASDLQDKVRLLQNGLSEEKAAKVLYWTCDKTARQVKKILKRDIPKEYNAAPGWIGDAVGHPRMSGGGAAGGVNCVIPLKGTKGTIGGKHFSAKGGAHGWNSLRRKYKVTALILKAGASTMPAQMSHQGGNPPFRNLGSKLGKVTFTRKTKARFPIVSVSGIAVPQMPMNRSMPTVTEDIHRALEKQLDYYIARMLP